MLLRVWAVYCIHCSITTFLEYDLAEATKIWSMYPHWPGIWSYINNGFSMRGLLHKILQPWTLRCIIFPLVITDLYIFYKSFLAVKCLGRCLFLTVTIWTSSGAQMMQGFFLHGYLYRPEERGGEEKGRKRREKGKKKKK